ncbi:MAG: Rab family GTPase [Candidatus Asgardarchaeia archaeon]
MPKYVVKVVVIGDGGVGKTSLVRRFVKNVFSNDYKLTIGSDFGVKKLHVDGIEVVISIFDVGGQDQFKHVRKILYKGASGAVAVFDLSDNFTFENMKLWIEELMEVTGRIPIIIVGNKVDLRLDSVETMDIEYIISKISEMEEYFGMDFEYVETSAKDSINVEQPFYKLVEKIISKDFKVMH